MLSVLIWLPFVGMILMGLIPKARAKWHRWVALGMSVGQLLWLLAAVLPAFLEAQATSSPYPTFYLQESIHWISMQMGSLGQLQLEYA